MKTKYYEYNKQIGGEKYSEFTESEYLKAKEDKNRWFISFGDSVLECEENEYKDYFSKKNHYDYTQKDKLDKKVVPILLEQYTYSDTAQAFFYDSTIVPFDEVILEKLSTEQYILQLRKVMKKLKPYEREIIYQLFWQNKSQKQLAEEYGKSQQNINKITTRVLAKMLKMFENEK